MKMPLRAVFLLLVSALPGYSAITIDASASGNSSAASKSIGTQSFSTTSGNELLLAFISSDANSAGVSVSTVSGAGLTWAPVKRANGQLGTAEIWRAFSTSILSNVSVTATLSQSVAASITVVTFTGVDTSGTNGSGAIGATAAASLGSGAPTASLITTRPNSWVFGVGDDWDNAIARTPGSGQTIVHQFLASVGDTYWVQQQNSPTPTSGTTVTINDTAPTTDRYNLAICEILPPSGVASTFSITGAITPSTSGQGATVALSANGSTVATASALADGSFTFSQIPNGTYTVAPTKAGFSFNPPSQTAIVNGSNVNLQNFIASQTTFTVSGLITAGGGSTVVLSQSGATVATVTADRNGNYQFANIANGTYTVTPTKAGFSINPSSQTAIVNGSNVTVQNFTAAQIVFTISGVITGGGGSTVVLSQSGATVATVTADGNGNYQFLNIANGNYTVTPSKSGFTFNPPSQNVTVNSSNVSVPNITAISLTFTVTGAISGTSGATVVLSQSGTTIATVTQNSSGSYNFTSVANGTYTITPSETGFTFNPASENVTVNGSNVTAPNFTALPGTNLVFPDLRDIIPTNKMSVVQTGNGLQFQYTHDTLNAGPGPLVIQPVLNNASGTYQGTQYIYSLGSSNVFTLVQKIPLAGAFIFDSDHGHFHFPFVTYGLYAVSPNGGPGAPVALSGKISFCINDSFIFEPNIPNAGALGNLGSCSDPTSLRGLDIGAVDEYDQTDPGQSISLAGVPDGTYWLRALVDPNNFLAEADKTNNETDVELTISGTTVTIIQTVTPVLNPPPSITLTSPTNGSTVFGTINLTATTPMTSGVQFLVDGQAFGNVVTTVPYTLPLDTTTLQNGAHWIAAQTTDPTGIIGTSPVALVTVSSSGATGPVPQLASPANGSILNATVSLWATVASSQPIATVTYFVDFVSVGTLSTPPYILSWDSTSVPDGQHTITITATDTLGNSGKSVPVTVNVNNSHPANLIGIDAQVSVDGQDALTTPAFSTTAVGDLLVAFVATDGPSNAPQTANVSGAGLTWTLLERSNTEAGTAEIWSARIDGTVTNVAVTARPQNGSGFHGSLTVIAFTNCFGTSVVGRTGAPGGAPDILVPGVIAGDWIFAVGNDWDNAIGRTPVSGQVLVHQRVDNQVGDTYWVQSTSAPSTANALVDIHDTAPTSDRWNYAAVEIVATHQ